MVSYDEAVAIVQDPQADPVMLAKVAYENPEFGANVAAHPRAYPGLKRWIAQFGDERARRMVAQQGYEPPLGPIEDREEAAQRLFHARHSRHRQLARGIHPLAQVRYAVFLR